MTILYNKDNEIVTVADIDTIIPAENGTKFLLQTELTNVLIPANKLLSITA